MFAVFSDVHGNREALSAVLAALKPMAPEKTICLGDLVGYGPDPDWCLDAVLKACDVVLCGNHDFALIHGAGDFTDVAESSINYHRQLIMPRWNSSPEDAARLRRWNALKQLHHRLNQNGRLFVHGSPRNPINEYLRERDVKWGPKDKMTENFALVDWIAFIGHTHRPGIITADMKFLKVEEVDNLYRVMPGRKAIINVGSVGQPRDGNPRASFVTVEGPEVRFHRVEYDVARTIAKIEADGILDYHLAARLRKGT